VEEAFGWTALCMFNYMARTRRGTRHTQPPRIGTAAAVHASVCAAAASCAALRPPLRRGRAWGMLPRRLLAGTR
jgi:hypothetical protein